MQYRSGAVMVPEPGKDKVFYKCKIKEIDDASCRRNLQM